MGIGLGVRTPLGTPYCRLMVGGVFYPISGGVERVYLLFENRPRTALKRGLFAQTYM